MSENTKKEALKTLLLTVLSAIVSFVTSLIQNGGL